MKACADCTLLQSDPDSNFCYKCKGCLIEIRGMVCIKCGKDCFMSPCYNCTYPKENESIEEAEKALDRF